MPQDWESVIISRNVFEICSPFLAMIYVSFRLTGFESAKKPPEP